jgi:hypothetical protein
MKTAFCLASVLVTAAPPAALVAGVFPSAALTLPVVVGFLAASGVLALAVCDYARLSAPRLPRLRQPTLRVRPAGKTASAGAANTWAYRTASA